MTAAIFICVLCLLLLAIGWLLAVLSGSRHEEGDLTLRVEQVLPGTQCGQCGYPGCAAYAQAMCSGEAAITRCVPGGPDTVRTLAALLGVDPDEEQADSGDELIFRPRQVAFIHKDPCTGCTKCIRVCPMDCILGKPRYVHEVMPEECIACGECVRVCPEKCIEIISMEPTLRHFNWDVKSIRITGSPRSL